MSLWHMLWPAVFATVAVCTAERIEQPTSSVSLDARLTQINQTHASVELTNHNITIDVHLPTHAPDQSSLTTIDAAFDVSSVGATGRTTELAGGSGVVGAPAAGGTRPLGGLGELTAQPGPCDLIKAGTSCTETVELTRLFDVPAPANYSVSFDLHATGRTTEAGSTGNDAVGGVVSLLVSATAGPVRMMLEKSA
ncbi:MAG: hypothetical protein M1838_000969 [Thelocarpon superellum]|nr:MAG: hypothetical protein M1838_000969 [Thelocarpon superellum]